MTHEEAIAILTRLKSELDPTLIGDIRPYAIDWVIEQLRNGTSNGT